MTRRSPVPSTITDPEQQRFFDELWKRRIAEVTPPTAASDLAAIRTWAIALDAAMRASGAMEDD